MEGTLNLSDHVVIVLLYTQPPSCSVRVGCRIKKFK